MSGILARLAANRTGMSPRIPEMSKIPGVCYAFTEDGLELPVVDISHPAFSLEITEAKMNEMLDRYAAGVKAVAQMPKDSLRAAAESSILLRGLVAAEGTFVAGLATYLYRLGPENLGAGYSGPLDRQLAAGIFATSLRVRQQHIVRHLADALGRSISDRLTCPVHLINIAGGVAADSWNALIALNKQHPGSLAGRKVRIHVLDIDSEGPGFGARAVEALRADGGPMDGLDVTLQHATYDWNYPDHLRALLRELHLGDAVAVGSSEGGLFEYARDEVIRGNLEVLRMETGKDFTIVGGVMRDLASTDARIRPGVGDPLLPALRFIGLGAFQNLAATAGWKVSRVTDNPTCHIVNLEKS